MLPRIDDDPVTVQPASDRAMAARASPIGVPCSRMRNDTSPGACPRTGGVPNSIAMATASTRRTTGSVTRGKRLTPRLRLPDAERFPGTLMSERIPAPATDALTTIYRDLAAGGIDRREFMRRAAALGVAGAAATTLGSLVPADADAAALAQQTTAAAKKIPLELAEWSYLWVNVRRAETARGTFVGGQQMYVEYMIPAQVRHQIPVVLVHGGGGQGTDWMGTPDGRPGWFQYLASEGFKVYVVDRPGHGRSPIHPELHGGFPATAMALESIAGRFTPPSANPAAVTTAHQKNHTQWPGPGNVGSPDLDHLTAGMGGSYVVTPPP